MKIIRNISKPGKWVFNDGSDPIQLRIMRSEEIHLIKHLHKTMYEYFYVLDGIMKISVNETIFYLKKDDIIYVEPKEVHQVVEKSSDLKLLLIMPPPVENDKVEL